MCYLFCMTLYSSIFSGDIDFIIIYYSSHISGGMMLAESVLFCPCCIFYFYINVMCQGVSSWVTASLVDVTFSVGSDINGWYGGPVVGMSDSRSRGPGFDSWPVYRQATALGKLLTPMCLCHQAVQFGTGQRVVMLCGWEGNRGSGIALAMRHRF